MTSLVDEEAPGTLFLPPPYLGPTAHVDGMENYRKMYQESVDNPDGFWAAVAADFFWKTPATGPVLKSNFDVRNGPIFVQFMTGASTNICYNALDRNVERGLGDKIAYFWEGNNVGDEGKITFSQLLQEVCKFSNVLKAAGLEKGDRVAIYLPMILELPVAILACARIGVVHSVVFGGFSAESLTERMIDGQCSVLVTAGKPTTGSGLTNVVAKLCSAMKPFVCGWVQIAGTGSGVTVRLSDLGKVLSRYQSYGLGFFVLADGVWRGDKFIDLKKIADDASGKCAAHGHVVTRRIIVKHMGPSQALNGVQNGHADHHHAKGDGIDRVDLYCQKKHHKELVTPWDQQIDRWWHEEVVKVPEVCPPVWMNSEDPLFMLYTSGSTGKPKGVLHTVAGYMVYTAFTFKCVFDYQDNDVYWCTADAGWITGHSYVVYGPLINGCTGIVFEGIPTHPQPDRFWEVIAKYRVTKFYTAPTAIRSLMKFGEELVLKHDRTSLKILGTVGEPINPEAWLWYHKYVGEERCPIVDTFWQTETGGHVLTPLPAATPLKPGSATLPFFGVVPAVLDEDGHEITQPDCEGYLVFKKPWPGIMRSLYANHKRYEETYFHKFPGYYTTGDGCKRDADGYYWITGRIDDMVNVSGHLLSTAEIESALVEHPSVSEAAVVSHPHKIKGECTYGFVTMKVDHVFTAATISELKLKVRERIGAFAVPDFLQDAPGLPKTRSGKIMRRILRKIARGDRNLGDTSTMADSAVIETLFQLRPKNA